MTSFNFYFRISAIVQGNRAQRERIVLGSVFKLRDKQLKDGCEDGTKMSLDDNNFSGEKYDGSAES